MGVSNPDDTRRVATLALALISLCFAARYADAAELTQGEIDYSADEIVTQLRTDTLELTGNVRVQQDRNVITADRGQLKAAGDRNQARFQGSVHVRTVEAELRADDVSAELAKGQLSAAHAEGSPAEFQQLSGTADNQGQGRAQSIDYDVAAGVVKLTGGAEPVWFVYGKEKNEFRTDTLTYNMRTGTVSTGRTQGIIRLNGKGGTSNESTSRTDGETPPDGGDGA